MKHLYCEALLPYKFKDMQNLLYLKMKGKKNNRRYF